MLFSLTEVIALIGGIGTLFAGVGGVAAWRNTSIDRRESVTKQLEALNVRLTAELERRDRDAEREKDELEQRISKLQAQASQRERDAAEREKALQQQITDVQRQATEREMMLQTEISRLNSFIAKQAQRIADLEARAQRSEDREG